MVVEDVLSYSKYSNCMKSFNNGECFRKDFKSGELTISLEQYKVKVNENESNLTKLAIISYKNDALAIPLTEEINYKELVKEISMYVYSKLNGDI